MAKNQKGLLALGLMMLVSLGIVLFGLRHGFERSVAYGFLTAALVMAIDLLVRKPGKSPNQKVIVTTKAFAVLIYPVLTLFSHGRNMQNLVGVYFGALVLVLCIYFSGVVVVVRTRNHSKHL